MPTVLLETFGTGGNSWLFKDPVEVLRGDEPEQVPALLRLAQRRVGEGFHAAGFVSYEAAPAFDRHLAACRNPRVPLLLLGIYPTRTAVVPGEWAPHPPGEFGTAGWTPSVSRDSYLRRFRRIREYIAGGHAYQVNFTYREKFSFRGDPFALYRRMTARQQAPYCAWIEAGDLRVLSASPELFFSLQEDRIAAEPMKGTARREEHPEADLAAALRLADDPKERAENLMITDLLRNDLGRIAVPGSVHVPQMFRVSSLPTVHQMTSRVTALLREGCGVPETFSALFPCGSVTGAPKRRAMEIAAELEGSPRGLYTGAIGHISPGEAAFSVAIRTALIDLPSGRGELGIGSGVTWYSSAEGEHAECAAKGAFVRGAGDFRLIETLLCRDGDWFLLERHLRRLERSANELGFTVDGDRLALRLQQQGAGRSGQLKGRVLLQRDGSFSVEVTPLDSLPETAQLFLSRRRVRSADPFLRHKTTLRDIFDDPEAPAGTESLFLNERGEVTESSTANVVLRLQGELVTPPLSCGLLPGVMREE
ncbi:MAG TPA: aminodeoxychorismate synthase component I, partial [Verrucomicrobiae bacterium]|nr:aminodeoxychorismate synthase component I [Verrucomicrobiae bacterium]